MGYNHQVEMDKKPSQNPALAASDGHQPGAECHRMDWIDPVGDTDIANSLSPLAVFLSAHAGDSRGFPAGYLLVAQAVFERSSTGNQCDDTRGDLCRHLLRPDRLASAGQDAVTCKRIFNCSRIDRNRIFPAAARAQQIHT